MSAQKLALETLYEKYNKREYLNWDPLGMLDASLSSGDFEIVSLLAAGLAYGRVEQCRKSLKELLERISTLGPDSSGYGIRELVENHFEKESFLEALEGWKHRLNTAFDIVELMENLNGVFKSHKSLAELFQQSHCSCPKEHIVNFCQRLAPLRSHRKYPGTGASWFAASPERGSSCKRFLLWLKWMIRKDEIDTGLWQRKELLNLELPEPDPARLFIPMDTHLFKWALKNGATKRKNISWKMTEEVTDFMKKIDASDPAKYDFAICHEGIMEFRKASL